MPAFQLFSSSRCYFSLTIVIGLILAAEGCGSPFGLSVDGSESSDSRKSLTVLDAGVLFANEASYICIPLEKLGIDPVQSILSIKSSCECIQPSVVRYLQRRSQEGIALRLDFVDDSKGQEDETSPSLLAVEIKFQFANETEQSITIQFLHTLAMRKAS